MPQVVLVGLFPRSLRRLADCLVYRDRFVFVGLSRKDAAKRSLGGGAFDLAMLPLAAVVSGTGMAAAEVAEAAAKSRSILFVDIKQVRVSKFFGFSVKITLTDGSTETLVTGRQFTNPKAIEACFRQVVPHAFSG